MKEDNDRTLLIADPHIGWEMELQEKGIHVPSQTGKLLNKLVSVLTEVKPDKLIILGDVKYTVVSSELSEWHDVPDFFTKLRSYVSKMAVVRGNHDANLEPLLPEGVELLPATGVVIGDVGVFHGHKWPSPDLLGCRTLVMGHLHPMVVFRDPTGFKMNRQIWMKITVNPEALGAILLQKSGVKIKGSVEETLRERFGVRLKASELYIMPSFNDFLGGRPVNESRARKDAGSEALIGPVLRSKAVNIDEAELFLLDGTYLGTLSQLRNM